MKRRNILNSPRLREIKKKKRKVFWLWFFGIIFILSLLSVGLVFLARWEKINIRTVEVVGVEKEDTKLIQNLAWEKISKNYFFFLPKTNIFLLPKKEIEEELALNHREFKDLEMKVKENFTFEISLTERKPEYLWCGEEFSLTTPIDQCFFMDDTGFIFSEAPYFSGDVYFKFFGKVAQRENPLGVFFLPETFEKVNLFRETLEKINLKPVSFSSLPDGEMEFYLASFSSTLELPPRIIFKTETDFLKLAENLQTALETEPLLTEFKNKYAFLEYLDLRFDNRVYYKFK